MSKNHSSIVEYIAHFTIMISREHDLQILDFLNSIQLVFSTKINPGGEIPDATRHKTRKKGATGNYS